MRLKVLTLAIAFLSFASFAQAGRFEVAPRLGVFVPTGDAGKQFESAVDAGITATYWYRSAVGIGLDLGFHRLPGSQSANQAADALLSGLAGAPITGSKWSWRGLQATPHVKTASPGLGSVLPWISVGAGLFGVDPDLDIPVDQLEVLPCALLLVASTALGASSSATPSRPPTSPRMGLEFDYSAAERMVDAIDRPALSESEARSLLENRGIAAMVKKTGVFSPTSTPQGFVADMQSFVSTHKYPTGDFALDWIYKYRDQVRTLVGELRAGEAAMRSRITGRLTRYAPRTGAVTIKVYFVAGGMSDGFVLDGDPELALFVALEKASGDREGVEQNVTHELYHVLQKASAAGKPAAVKFASSLASQPPLQQLLATTLWEGTANLAADARETKGQGPYASMWRDRYVRNLTPQRTRESFQVFDSVVADLDQGKMDWDTAYKEGFSGSADSRFYFVGMEMGRALGSARGAGYFGELFVRPPTRFFRDYFELCAADTSLPRFSAGTRRVIEQLPVSW